MAVTLSSKLPLISGLELSILAAQEVQKAGKSWGLISSEPKSVTSFIAELITTAITLPLFAAFALAYNLFSAALEASSAIFQRSVEIKGGENDSETKTHLVKAWSHLANAVVDLISLNFFWIIAPGRAVFTHDVDSHVQKDLPEWIQNTATKSETSLVKRGIDGSSDYLGIAFMLILKPELDVPGSVPAGT